MQFPSIFLVGKKTEDSLAWFTNVGMAPFQFGFELRQKMPDGIHPVGAHETR
jgi:hypothetical protein